MDAPELLITAVEDDDDVRVVCQADDEPLASVTLVALDDDVADREGCWVHQCPLR